MSEIILKEINFDSGFRGNYKGYHIDPRLVKEVQLLSPIYCKLLTYQSSKIISTPIMALEMYDSIIYLNRQIERIYKNNYDLMHINGGIIGNIRELSYEKEIVIHLMKRIIDDIIMVLCIFYDKENFSNNKKIEISSLGCLLTYLNKKNFNSDLYSCLKKDFYIDKYSAFFETLNSLHNAFKHSCLMTEAHTLYSPDCVSVKAYYAKYNDVSCIEFHNHNLMHLIIGFSDFMLEFFGVDSYQRIGRNQITERKIIV